MPKRTDTVVALDAMGVLYEPGEDVSELLIPYLRERGCPRSAEEIELRYVECSLGRLTSTGFWQAMEVMERASDVEYCQLHRLTDGVVPLLAELHRRGIPVACLSNDVLTWSVLLRRRFGLERYIGTWVVSAEAGARKPDAAIYQELLDRTGVSAADAILVDDRVKNIDAAAALGMRTVLFGATAPTAAPAVSSMAELRELIDRWT